MSLSPIGPEVLGLGERVAGYFLRNPMGPGDVVGIGREDVPALVEVLKDPRRSRLWGAALLGVCVLADAEDAFRIVVGHIREVHDFGVAGPLSVVNKVGSVGCLGWVDGAVTGDFLARSITEEGARDVIGVWLKAPLPSMCYGFNLEQVYRRGAAHGLVLLQQDQYIEPLRAEYERLKSASPAGPDSQMLASIIGFLALNDMIKDKGFEEAWRLITTTPPDSLPSILIPYHMRYDRELAALYGLQFGPGGRALSWSERRDLIKEWLMAGVRRVVWTVADVVAAVRRRRDR